MTAVSWTVTELDELRAENSDRYAERGIRHSCLFDDRTDDTIETGFGCGGCSCHLSSPCRHCLVHLDPQESHEIRMGLDLQGRSTPC